MYGNSTHGFFKKAEKISLLCTSLNPTDKKKIGIYPPLICWPIEFGLLPRFILHISGIRHLELGSAGQIVHDP